MVRERIHQSETASPESMNRGRWFGVPASAGEAFDLSSAQEFRKPCRLKAGLLTPACLRPPDFHRGVAPSQPSGHCSSGTASVRPDKIGGSEFREEGKIRSGKIMGDTLDYEAALREAEVFPSPKPDLRVTDRGRGTQPVAQ